MGIKGEESKIVSRKRIKELPEEEQLEAGSRQDPAGWGDRSQVCKRSLQQDFRVDWGPPGEDSEF